MRARHGKGVSVAAMYTSMFGQMKKQLGQLQGWFDLAAQYAKTKPFDVEILLASRLSPDGIIPAAAWSAPTCSSPWPSIWA